MRTRLQTVLFFLHPFQMASQLEMAPWRGLSTSLAVDKDIRLLEEKLCSVITRERGVALYQNA